MAHAFPMISFSNIAYFKVNKPIATALRFLYSPELEPKPHTDT